MRLKDHYRTLNLAPTASTDEIRKAFRELAHKYHPDKTLGDKQHEAYYREIQEAYKILSDTKSREEYNHQRFSVRSLGKKYTNVSLTPDEILKDASKLSAYLSTVNHLHIDHDVLSFQIRNILSASNIEILRQSGNQSLNSQLIRTILHCTNPLPYQYVEPIALVAANLAGGNENMQVEIRKYSLQREKARYWDKRRGWIVLLVTLLICAIMYIYAS